MANDYADERAEVLEAVGRVVALGLVAHASGNVSRRIEREGGDYFAVTASRVPYHRFALEDVVVVDANIDSIVGDGLPSSESLAHLAVTSRGRRRRRDPYPLGICERLRCGRRPIPCVLDEQVVSLGGQVEVAEYAPSASEELAEHAVLALSDRAAVLLRHHGVLAVGRISKKRWPRRSWSNGSHGSSCSPCSSVRRACFRLTSSPSNRRCTG